ncbi:type II secretion system protein [Singulisphaera rosea]
MRRNSSTNLRPKRRAFTLIEITVISAMLVAAMATTLQVVSWVAIQRRATDRRQLAIQEVANLMERLAARPWNRLNAEGDQALALSDSARSGLPGARLEVDVDVLASEGAKRIRMRLSWRNRAGTMEAPVRLTAWRYRGKEER